MNIFMMLSNSSARHGFGILILYVLVSANTVVAAPMDTDQAVTHLADRLFARPYGDIAQVKQETVYIAVGEREGILEGSEFDIVRLGAKIQVGSELLGYEEKLIGKAVAERVQERLTVSRMLAKLEVARVGDRAYLRRQHVTRVVIAPFTIDDKVSSLGLGIQENLITALLSKGISVVERSQLERVLEEQRLGLSGFVDLGSAKTLGELLGADAMIVGSLRDLGETVDVNARLVALDSGTGLRAAQARIAKTAIVAQQLALGPTTSVGENGRVVGSNLGKSFDQNGDLFPTFENDFVRIEAVSLKNKGKRPILALRFLNVADDAFGFRLSELEGCYISNESGSRRVCKSLSWDSEKFLGDRFELVPDVPRAEWIELESGEEVNGAYVFTAKALKIGELGRLEPFLVIIRNIDVR
ncbi:FlgO family outer membrane protein [Thiocapsa imhoffii]|uniref:FlgO family outer membrane protein n=1 Tax=Thiocapsa imhoffii TaxID=382777 RepID=UPI001902FD2C